MHDTIYTKINNIFIIKSTGKKGFHASYKNGSIQPFDINKVLLTVERTSDEAKTPLTASDLRNIGNVVTNKLKNKASDYVHATEIKTVVIETLQEMGFAFIAKHYSEPERHI